MKLFVSYIRLFLIHIHLFLIHIHLYTMVQWIDLNTRIQSPILDSRLGHGFFDLSLNISGSAQS